MSDHAEEYQLFSDPRRLVEDGRIATQERRRHLAAIFAPPEPEPAGHAIDELAEAVAERIVQRVQAVEPDVEPEGRSRGFGFDAGARASVPPPPESHGETLVRLLRSRAADRGASF